MSEQPIRLSDAFLEGGVLDVMLRGTSAQQSPGKGKAWLVLSGIIAHVIGTASLLRAERLAEDGAIHPFWQTEIKAADTTDIVPMCNNTPEQIMAQFQLIILRSNDQLCFTGAATAYARVRVLEWDVARLRGVPISGVPISDGLGGGEEGSAAGRPGRLDGPPVPL